jgi:hypothetical protein
MASRALVIVVVFGLGLAAGCSEKTKDTGAPGAPGGPKGMDESARVEAARAKLPPEKRKLIDAQDYCPLMPGKRLGSMGDVREVTVQGKTVFVCCPKCVMRAQNNPDEALAKLEELKNRQKQ